MGIEKRLEHAPSEWKNETIERGESIRSFLETHSDNRPHYDSTTDLHFSGSNIDVVQKIKEGTAAINEVSVFYDNGKIQQIHIVFDSEGSGHNIDVYLKNKALEDYLSEELSEE